MKVDDLEKFQDLLKKKASLENETNLVRRGIFKLKKELDSLNNKEEVVQSEEVGITSSCRLEEGTLNEIEDGKIIKDIVEEAVEEGYATIEDDEEESFDSLENDENIDISSSESDIFPTEDNDGDVIEYVEQGVSISSIHCDDENEHEENDGNDEENDEEDGDNDGDVIEYVEQGVSISSIHCDDENENEENDENDEEDGDNEGDVVRNDEEDDCNKEEVDKNDIKYVEHGIEVGIIGDLYYRGRKKAVISDYEETSVEEEEGDPVITTSEGENNLGGFDKFEESLTREEATEDEDWGNFDTDIPKSVFDEDNEDGSLEVKLDNVDIVSFDAMFGLSDDVFEDESMGCEEDKEGNMNDKEVIEGSTDAFDDVIGIVTDDTDVYNGQEDIPKQEEDIANTSTEVEEFSRVEEQLKPQSLAETELLLKQKELELELKKKELELLKLQGSTSDSTSVFDSLMPDEVIEEDGTPKTLRELVKKNPNCEISFALKYFSKKEIDRDVKLGKVYIKKNKLFI